jgi:hypothetical protein
MKEKSTSQSGFFGQRALIAFLFCAGIACSVLTGASLGFLRSEESAKTPQRTLTFAERVAYQRAIEEVYWRHRIWPKERPDLKPSLDELIPPAQLEKKVEDYLRNSQALEDYWQRPLTAEQLQAEMERMAQHTKQPEVLRELFEALANDPFVIAECLARPALAERLLTNLYGHDERIHGELRRRAEGDLQAHPSLEQMKQSSGNYSEIEFVRCDDAGDEGNCGAERSLKLNSRRAHSATALKAGEWDETVQKIAAIFSDHAVAAGVSPAKGAPTSQIKTGVVSPLQEDEARYYATAVIEKANDHLKLATISWLKEPRLLADLATRRSGLVVKWSSGAGLISLAISTLAGYTIPAGTVGQPPALLTRLLSERITRQLGLAVK